MLYGTFEKDKPYLWKKFSDPEFDAATGLDNDFIKAEVLKLAESMKNEPRKITKARLFEYITRNVRIDVSPHDWFVGFACWDRNDRFLSPIVYGIWNEELDEKCPDTITLRNSLRESAVAAIWPDFDHSVPDWDAVFELGFSGLRQRARNCRREREAGFTLTDEAAEYFDAIEITYKAIIEMMERFYSYTIEHADGNLRMLEVGKCLRQLIEGAPRNTFEVLQLIYLYFIFSEHIDHMQVRSLSNLDQTLYPYYKNDLENGTYTELQIRELIDYFLMQYASINNYWGHPFYLGGTKSNGESKINELSFLILEEFEKLDICSPKIQLKIADNTPPDFLEKALNMVRSHNSSLVFVSEKNIKRAMMGLGFSEDEARECDINGCYEYNVKAREVKTGPVYLNLLKPVELVFNNGIDPSSGIKCGCETGEVESLASFSDFYKAYIKQLEFILESSFKCVDEFEQYLHLTNPANVFSATIENSLRTARDAFAHGSVYNNTIILHTGLASAADSLAAIRQLVYEGREVSLSEMKKILASDWQRYENLRLKILNSKQRFGNGCGEVDSIAEAIGRFCSNKINMRPNSRGGFYKAAMHSARTFITLGELTGATPDGRKKGDEMSKNISPVMGMDVNGVTALLNSVSQIDSALFPEDYALDVMLHPATTEGDEGLEAMKNLVRVYMDRNGASIHFNIFDANVLLEAQRHPEKYRGLQVRVCGWNVRFTDLCKEEQDAYIKRAINIQ